MEVTWLAVKRILGRSIIFHRIFLFLTGDLAASLFLSQACYWSDIKEDEGGWFYKSAKDWEQETGLSWYLQKKSRTILLNLGVLDEEENKIEHQIYFRVNYEVLLEKVGTIKIPESKGFESGDQKGSDSPIKGIRIRSLSESTTESTTEIAEGLSEEGKSSPSKEREDPQGAYRAAKSRYRTLCRGKLGNLGEKHGEVWASLISQYGEKKVLGAFEIWASELHEPKRLGYPIAVFLKNADEFLDAYEIHSSPMPEEEEKDEDRMLTGKDIIREREERERELERKRRG
jgi:hypothetical protein